MANKKIAAKVKAVAARKDAERLTVASVARSKKAARKAEKERIANLQRDGLTKRQAKEVVRQSTQDASSGLVPGLLVQYEDQGRRAGYVADVPAHGQVKIQPIGPRGSELPTQKFVKLENVFTVEDQYTQGANDMAKIQQRATSLKEVSEQQKATKAAKLAENLKKAQPAAAKEAATTESKPAKAPKAPNKALEVPTKKEPAAKKEAKGDKRNHAAAEQTWKFLKTGPATGQRALILEVLQSLGGSATRSKLEAALAKKLDSSQEVGTVLSLKKKFLVDNGCVKIS